MAEIRNETSEEGAAVIIQPDTVLPSQFFAGMQQKGFIEGEKRLVAAVLADAVECYMKQIDTTDPRGRQLFEEAETWIFTEDMGWFFSFDSICEILGLDPTYLRRGIVEWSKRRAPTLRRSAVFRPQAPSVGPISSQTFRKAVG